MRHDLLRSTVWRFVALLALAASGCGERRPQTYPVQGLLRFDDGRPVTFGAVEFRSPQFGLTARGTLDARGHFRLTTFTEGDGAVAGEQQVIVIQNVSAAAWQQSAAHAEAEHSSHAAQPTHDRSLVPRRYADYATSGLKATVEPRSENRVTLTVAR